MDYGIVALVLAVGSAGVLVGAFVGHWTAATDAVGENIRAWTEGWQRGVQDGHAGTITGEFPTQPNNPYERTKNGRR